MTFQPIAIVGRSCLVPGASSPEDLWQLVVEGRSAITSVDEGRWRADSSRLLCDPGTPKPDCTWSDRGGYVRDFDKLFDPSGFALAETDVLALDPLFQWVLHTAREALRDSGYSGARDRVGAVFGNLGFPSTAMSEFAESVWLGKETGPDPRNRFSSGLPALLLERALGLGGGGFTLDAACASSLYAIKMACDWLHEGRCDLALAGAVNRADDLFIHVGFTALQALSKTGQSRPFHPEADGLVAAEGAGFVALKRLADAERDNDHIWGVVRGVGLSNDGRGRGFLVPSADGQCRAMRSALHESNLESGDISLIECHATGTTLGDATELDSMERVYGESGEGEGGEHREHRKAADALPIGSLKSNLGHLITAAGVAGLVKVLEAIRHKTRPPTILADGRGSAANSDKFRVLTAAEDWPSEGPRHAAVSAFGFGGNNAHLIVSEYTGKLNHSPAQPATARLLVPVAIVGMGVTAANASGRAAFTEALFSSSKRASNDHADPKRPREGVADDFAVDVASLGIPPNDLDQTLAQQLLLLEAGREACRETGPLPSERTGVYVGLGADPEVARFGARWRYGEGFVEPLRAAGVVGTMSNIPANRLNRLFDLGGGSCAVSAEEASGLVALDLAVGALRRGELDAALVGAVDLSCEPVHREAARECLDDSQHNPGDAALVLVVKRLADARRDGDRIYAVVDQAVVDREAASETTPSDPVWGPQHCSLTKRFGHAHAASGLLHLAAAALSVHHRRRFDGAPWIGPDARRADVLVRPMDGTGIHAWSVSEVANARKASEQKAPLISLFQGADRDDVAAALAANRTSSLSDPPRPARLVIVAGSKDQLAQRMERARAHLELGSPKGQGVHFRTTVVSGEAAFVFTSAGAAYPGMGAELLGALPELGDTLAQRFAGFSRAFDWVFGDSEPTATDRLWAASSLCQLHAQVSLDLLGLKPSAAIGYSSGESNALFAFGAWRDMDAMQADCKDAGLFDRDLGGQFRVAKDLYGEDASWSMWSILAPIEEVRAVLASIAGEPLVHLAIIHTASDCVIGGVAKECARVVSHLGAHRCKQLDYCLTVHVPELEHKRDAWLAVHRRKTFSVPNVRFYSAAYDEPYLAESERCAHALLGQAQRQLDLRPMIERAWADGVRTFIEHGPGASCSHWIREILGPERLAEAVVVPLDRRGHGLEQIVDVLGELIAAGVNVEHRALLARLEGATQTQPVSNRATLRTIAAHPPAVSFVPKLSTNMSQQMRPAPELPRVLDGDYMVAARTPSTSHAVDAPAPAPAPTPTPTPIATPTPTPAPIATPTPVGTTRIATPLPMSPLASPLTSIIETHTQFLSQQAAVHQAFLAMRTNLERLRPGQPSTARSARRYEPAASLPVAPSAPAAPPSAPPSPQTVKPQSSPPSVQTSSLAPPANNGPTGPRFDRKQLELAASGKLSALFGPLFAQQDRFARQVRMPEPPLLLADRVTGIDAEPGVMGRGTIWTETDVLADSWHLNGGRMPAGIFIESGQADLLLISWMGADFANQGERVYRLLGCTLTFVGDLPVPGETLAYDIHVDGHARHDEVRLFFFHYDCHIDGALRLSVRDGQAGFFTDEELASSDGIVWSPETSSPRPDPRLGKPDQLCEARTFSAARVRAFADGKPHECFGAGFETTECHVQSPRIQRGDMLFLEEISEFSPSGGPWSRGYLKARAPIAPGDWYFEGHFKNDPCMPGTLMFEGCVQALSFYLAALGFTIKRDGWRFRPVCGEPIEMKCRGQATPSSQEITYEVFVEEVIEGPEPTIYADLLCTIDGLKAFHAKRVGLSLVPDWPLESRPELLDNHVETKPVAIVKTPGKPDFAFDYESLLSCAWGKPSKAFGPIYERFDSPRGVARLPGPPYHFITRILSVKGMIGEPKAGAEVVTEYDVSGSEWYFEASSSCTMPYAVLLEAALQPCGWLASYVGCALTVDTDLLFRNLDGTGTQHAEVRDDGGCIKTHVRLTSVSKSAGMIIVGFTVETRQGDTLIFDMTTVFGFFPSSAFDNQAGLAVSDQQRALFEQPSETRINLETRPARFFEGGAALPGSKLDMLNRITGYWPDGGPGGLGAMRAVKDVHPSDWYFRAHFFQDPVQPGSLGIEALIQLLQSFMLHTGMDEGVHRPRFEPIATGHPMTWKYRGQVVPTNKHVTSTIEITELGEDERGPLAICEGSLWVDGLRIYSASNLGMRIVGDIEPPSEARAQEPNQLGAIVLDPQRDAWLADHRPTWNRASLPMMSIVDRLAQGASGRVTGLRAVRVSAWVDFDGPRRLHTRCHKRSDSSQNDQFVELWATPLGDLDAPASLVASARVQCGEYGQPPQPLPAISGDEMPDPYESGRLFHGPSFQRLIRATVSDVRHGANARHGSDVHHGNDVGASAVVDATVGTVPVGVLNPALLDAALHAIPHDELHRWSSKVAEGQVAYPARVLELAIFGPTPTSGHVRCEVRFDGFLVEPSLPRFHVQLIAEGKVWATFTLIEACYPKGRLGSAAPRDRRGFLRDQHFVEGLRLSRRVDDATRLSQVELDATDWMPGTVQGIYGSGELTEVAILEHIAAREHIHPRAVRASLPLSSLDVEVTRDGVDVVVRDRLPAAIQPQALRPFWNRALGIERPWLGRDLWEGLLKQYVARVVLEDAASFEEIRGQGVLFLGNHQVQIESLLVTNVLSGLTNRAVVTMANAKHENRWIGWILRHLFAHPNCRNPNPILYFDQKRPASMFEILDSLKPDLAAGKRSFFLHPQGTRGRSCRDRTTKVSSSILDLAIELKLPIVPIRFVGGLPVESVDDKLEFPHLHGTQDYVIGAHIDANELRALPYAQRGPRVLDALNALTVSPTDEQPGVGNREFADAVRDWQQATGAPLVESVFYRILEQLEEPSDETRQLLLTIGRRGNYADSAVDSNVSIPGEDSHAIDTWIDTLATRLSGK